MVQRRVMPSMANIARFHDLGETPLCVRCGLEPSNCTWKTVGGRLQRAHIIDRVCGGSDDVSNIAPLCEWCHSNQPIFDIGDEGRALIWFGLTPETRFNDDRFIALDSLRRLTWAICNFIPGTENVPEDALQESLEFLAKWATTPFWGRGGRN